MSKQREIAERLAAVIEELGLADDPEVIEGDGRCYVFFSHPQIERAMVSVERPNRIWVSEPGGVVSYRGEEFAIAALERLEPPDAVLERRRENPKIAERLAAITQDLGIDAGGVRQAAGGEDIYLILFSHPGTSAHSLAVHDPRTIVVNGDDSVPDFVSESEAASYLRTLTLSPEERGERELARAGHAAEQAAVKAWEQTIREPTPEEFEEIRRIVKRTAPLLSRWAWTEDRYHDGSDEYLLALVSNRSKHLINAHHALRDAGYAVHLDQDWYTAPWTGTSGKRGDVLVFDDLRPPEDMEWTGTGAY